MPDETTDFPAMIALLVEHNIGFDVRVASFDDLISMKRAANRIKDQLHILELQELQKLLKEEGVESNSTTQ